MKRGMASHAFEDEDGWGYIRYKYAKLCSVIVKDLYSQKTSTKPRREMLSTVKSLQQALAAWLMSVPSKYRPSRIASSGTCFTDERIRMDIEDKYYEAALAIHRWSLVYAGLDRGSEEDCATSTKSCLETAKSVLSRAQAINLDTSNVGWWVKPSKFCLSNFGTDWRIGHRSICPY